MRFCLLILLMAFHLGSFAGDEKSVVPGIQYAGNFEKKDLLQIEETSSFAKFSAHLTHFKHFKHISQQRQQTFVRFVTGSLLIKNLAVETSSSFIIADYSYCKPIRLILIFPQHYFW